jgi:DNA-binding transcriptional LysR family regulator
LGNVRPIVIGASSYLNRRGAPATPRDLGGHDVVAMSGAIMGGDRWQFRSTAETISVRVAPRLVVSTAEAAIDSAISGFGLTRVISYQAARWVASGALTWLLREFDQTEWPVHLLYPAGRHVPPKLRAFTTFAIPGLRRRLDEIEHAIASDAQARS